MIVTVLSRDRMNSIALPSAVIGGHWLSDSQGIKLAFIEGKGGAWNIEPVREMRAYGAPGGSTGAGAPIPIDPSRRAVMNLERADGERWSVIFYPDDAGARRSRVYGFAGDIQFSVGRAQDNAVVYGTEFVSAHHAQLSFRVNRWLVTDLGSVNGVFVNGRRIDQRVAVDLAYGDVVSILDLHLTVGHGLFSCNDPGGLVSVSPDFVAYRAVAPASLDDQRSPDPDFFYPALRFARTIEPKKFTVDAPPQPEAEDDTPLLMRIGPSMVMALASVLSASASVTLLMGQDASLLRAVPMVGMAVAMLAGSVLWPILSTRSQKKRREVHEAKRRAMYSQYLSVMLTKISREEESQKEILLENRVPVEECLRRAYTGDERLMDRTALHADYLQLRLGLGEEPLQAEIRFPDQHFSMDDDDIRRAVDEQAKTPRVLQGVPLAYPLIDKPVLGVIGDQERANAFVRGLVVQLAALDSYQDVKVVVLADELDREAWDFALHLPHCFSDDRADRYVAFGLEEAAELGMFMERVLEARRSRERRVEPRDEAPYYVVVCASEALADKAEIVRAVVGSRQNLGVSLVAIARQMRDLPKECRSVVGIEDTGAYLLDRDDSTGARRTFTPDIEVPVDLARGFAFAMGKVKLDIKTEDQHIPARLGFLEMERAGSVDHLSIASRWAESNASATLACPVGVDAQGDPFLLNLHEKFHGPHGLIAGTTGSGKSEFIITYILSLATTYSPNDVAFVLIDYKGGGLAKAFDNEHVRLPHLAGVITNLDGAAITRSLVSIKSELKRRQALFNRARDVVGGDNVDIYDYLDLFRQGRVSEPCPHLFIVADEFAELKQQQPDFMDELISAARIGRSLGVHLILATQKPSGVVNDQIWSNARFKVCLKVADEADSREMIRRPDAASITQAGRFYLLVGYNEHFALGQAAYAGTRYVPHERFTETQDDAVVLVGDTGHQLVTVKPERAVETGEDVPESVAVLRVLQRTADELGVHARQLWLEPVPAMVTVDSLAAKYRVAPGRAGGAAGFDLAPVIGELDDPERQRQAALALPLMRAGNALVYGTADSGAELVLRAAIYALLETYGPEDLNVYALDFGSESLRAFDAAPQVGDVICAADDERVRRFLDFIEAEQARRRELLLECGGSFERYRASGRALPAIVVVLNGIAAFLEAYPKLEDRIARFVREAGRGGIYLLMAADGSSSVRMRMRQSFRQVLAVNLPDVSDYSMIFSAAMHGVPKPKGYGRGLVKLEDGLFEFQAAHLVEGGDDYAAATGLSARLAERARAAGAPVAPPVPTVPKTVSREMLLDRPLPGACLPYGVYEDTLERACFDFDEVVFARVLYQRRKSASAFARALVPCMVDAPGWKVSVLDVARLLGDERPDGCEVATRIPEVAAARLAELLADANGAGPTDAPDQLVVVTGMAQVMAALSYDLQSTVKSALQSLQLSGRLRVIIVDAIADVTYNYDDWFKAQIRGKDGLWVGPGVDSQSMISVSYTPGLVADAGMKEARGYSVEGGSPRLVRLVSERS